jgi:predicted lipoprotein with Yx(FWY)xxD motif
MLAPVAFAQDLTVNVTKDPTLGDILVDSKGHTLYRFMKDTVNVSSACYDKCAVSWPPLLLDEGGTPVAGADVNGNLLGILTRKDGARQVMYNGMPLYYFNGDTNADETKGQGIGKVWFIVHPNTTTVGNQIVTIRAAQNAALGPYLTDREGRTLYLFMKDSESHSVCYGGCAASWPPLLVGATEATLDGIGGKLGVAQRNDGNNQVTYEGKPLYYYSSDANPGDTKGQGVGNVWFVLAPVAASAPAGAPAVPVPANPAAPAALPKTSGGGSLPLGAIAVLALLIGALGAVVRSRRRMHRM